MNEYAVSSFVDDIETEAVILNISAQRCRQEGL